jgi:hypothetical protein
MSINVNDKNIGHATAYAYYKAGGGTMTEAEFTEFMADFGTASQTAVEAAQAALASETAAQTAATTATNKASEATTAATTATTKAGEASTSASTATSAKDTAVSAASTATTKAAEATTAADTATSAKTDAVAANTAAQSAKTAAQTAQTGAETAAASVEASAAQIATNAADISQLKSDVISIRNKQKVITSSDYEAGSWTDTGEDGSTYHVIRVNNPIIVNKGDRLQYEPNSFYVRWLLIDSAGTLVEQYPSTANWSNDSINKVLRHSGKLYISVRNGWNAGNSQVILPSDIDFDISINYGGTLFNMMDVLCERGNIYRGNNSDESYLQVKRLRTSGYIKVSANDAVFSSIYRFGVQRYDNDKNWIEDAGWQSPNTAYIIPTDGFIRLVMGNTDDAEFSDDLIDTIRSDVFCCQYNPIVSTLNNANDIYKLSKIISPDISGMLVNDGEKINVKRQYYQVIGAFHSSLDHTHIAPNGMAIYDGKVFQFVNPDRLIVYNLTDGTVIKENSQIECDHGDCACFSNTFYDANDDYPLVYISADTNPAKVYINRIKNDYSTQLVDTLVFDTEHTGYYADHCADFDTNILFQVGYKENSYDSNPNGTNKTIVSLWDLSDLTDNGDDTKTPRFIGKYELPFIVTMQDMAFFDGKIFVISSNNTNTDTKVYAINPYTHSICNVLTQFNSHIKNSEQEGIDFVFNSDSLKYDMYLSNAVGYFYRIEFNE